MSCFGFDRAGFFLATGDGFLAAAFLGDLAEAFFTGLRVTFLEAGGVALAGTDGGLTVTSVGLELD